jgi:putative tryptophan/tyrosine transport system substrate-binding protein
MQFDRLKRREFITLLGGAAAWPLAARAQELAMPVIGFVSGLSPDLFAERVRGFREGLNQMGYAEGRNVRIEYRWAEGQNSRFPALVADLVRNGVSIIFAAGSTLSASAAQTVTTTIPIVFVIGSDPVESGLVRSLNRPGGNITGITNLNLELSAKRLELLHEVVPAAKSVALLVNPANPPLAEVDTRNVQRAASTLGLRVDVLHAGNESEFKGVFESLAKQGGGALVIGADVFFTSWRNRLAALSVLHAIPTIYQTREFAAAGGLLGYGSVTLESYRLGGVYCGRILKGERPAELPVQQSTKVELIINLRTAKTLGLTIPLPLLGRADEVIE